ncbi:MAG: aminotransferase class V-fold PLP-dependent enzyme [Rhodospirillales bacterium]|jgi:aromatic-L-amino-acid/L-tryptophan decarboxylase|nr:aminotransferase class V-fold PLP-dependent enzyme [Rhodospirillales bacterium]
MSEPDNPFEMDEETFRALGHKMIDQIADFISNVEDWPAAPDIAPENVHDILPVQTLPEHGMSSDDLISEAIKLVIGNSRINAHPKSWGYIIGSPAPIGILGDLLASAINPNLAAWDSAPVATEIELQTVSWIAELIGYPSNCGGIFTSGGNMANIVGFLAARRRMGGSNLRQNGVGKLQQRILYATRETHTWIEKAADISGMGTDSIHWIDTDNEQRMDLDHLRDRLEEDKDNLFKPYLLVGSAGTVSTGSIDPLVEMAEISKQNNMWFHVDGAYGGFAASSSKDVPEDIYGLREADSIAIDAHKWMFAPLEAGVALVRDKQVMLDTFSFDPPYYHNRNNKQVTHFHQYGPQNSRCFRALKAWLILRQAGRSGYVATLDHNIELAKIMHEAMIAAPEIEAFTRRLSINTFRYVPEHGLPKDRKEREVYLNDLNTRLLTAVQRGGEAHISNAIVKGKFLLRTCITNFRTRESDVRSLPEIIVRTGHGLHGEIG